MHDFNRVNAFTVKNQIVNGEYVQSGVGESATTVIFPVHFIEKPHFSFGGELTKDSSATDGKFPTISVVVLEWIMKEPEEDKKNDQNWLKRYFVGAILGVVTSGVAEKMNVHWRFEGKGLMNPFSSSENLDEII
jgi:hypothetical protein